jgi:hypothetical protein
MIHSLCIVGDYHEIKARLTNWWSANGTQKLLAAEIEPI